MTLTSLVALVLFVFAMLVILSLLAQTRITIFEYERGLKFQRGRFARVLEPGTYWYLPAFTRIQKVDIRPARLAVAGQEVLSADGAASRMRSVCCWCPSRASSALRKIRSPFAAEALAVPNRGRCKRACYHGCSA